MQSVAPLNEECGLIEWVPNLVGLRPLLIVLYKEKGLEVTKMELKTMMCGESYIFYMFTREIIIYITTQYDIIL